MSSDGLQIVGVRAVVAGGAAYVADAQKVNGATAGMASSSEAAEKRTKAAAVAVDGLSKKVKEAQHAEEAINTHRLFGTRVLQEITRNVTLFSEGLEINAQNIVALARNALLAGASIGGPMAAAIAVGVSLLGVFTVHLLQSGDAANQAKLSEDKFTDSILKRIAASAGARAPITAETAALEQLTSTLARAQNAQQNYTASLAPGELEQAGSAAFARRNLAGNRVSQTLTLENVGLDPKLRDELKKLDVDISKVGLSWKDFLLIAQQTNTPVDELARLLPNVASHLRVTTDALKEWNGEATTAQETARLLALAFHSDSESADELTLSVQKITEAYEKQAENARTRRALESQIPNLEALKDEIDPSRVEARKRAAEAAAREAEAAAKRLADEARRIAEEAQRAAEQLAQKAADSIIRIRRETVQQLDTLGELVQSALRKQLQEQEEAADSALAAERQRYEDGVEAQKAALDLQTKNELDAAQKAKDARLKAIDAVTKATIDGLNAQIAAINGAKATEDRAGLVRNIALAFDPQQRADAEKALADFDRNVQVESLRSQISAAQDSATAQKDALTERSDAEIKAIRDRGDAQDAALESSRKTELRSFDQRQKDLAQFYKTQTSDAFIQSKARMVIADTEQQHLVDLLTNYSTWNTAGKSFGEALLDGVRTKLEPYLRSLTNLIPGANGTSVAQQQNAEQIAALQDFGKRAKEAQVPSGSLDLTRQQIADLGGIPQFHTGLEVGMVTRPIIASLAAGEVVLTPEQQAAYMGPRVSFTRGAFEGMFNGANFAGSAADNARAIRAMFTDLMDRAVGRDAFINGVS